MKDALNYLVIPVKLHGQPCLSKLIEMADVEYHYSRGRGTRTRGQDS